MEADELLRERRRPEWAQVFLGTVVNFGVMGVLAMVGESLRLMSIHPEQSVARIVVELLWLLGSVTFGSFAGGFVAGFSQSIRSGVSAIMLGLLITQMSIVFFFMAGFFGYPILPGVTFSLNPGGTTSEGLIWWAMMISLPDLFASAFGAIAGNRLRAHLQPEGPLAVPEPAQEDESRRAA